MAARKLEAGEPLERAYNLGSGDGVSVRQIMDAMASGTGIAFDPEIAPRRPGDPARIVATGEAAASNIVTMGTIRMARYRFCPGAHSTSREPLSLA